MKYAFCNGILLGDGYEESACQKRDNCRYYDEMFYLRGYDLDEFEQLRNPLGKPCPYYLPVCQERKNAEQDPFGYGSQTA